MGIFQRFAPGSIFADKTESTGVGLTIAKTLLSQSVHYTR